MAPVRPLNARIRFALEQNTVLSRPMMGLTYVGPAAAASHLGAPAGSTAYNIPVAESTMNMEPSKPMVGEQWERMTTPN